MRLWLACGNLQQSLLHSRSQAAGIRCSLHTSSRMQALAGGAGEMAIDDLTSRLKDKSLLKLQALIGGHWVRAVQGAECLCHTAMQSDCDMHAGERQRLLHI